MANRDTWHEQLDDWFDEPDTSAALEERPARLERSRDSLPPSHVREAPRGRRFTPAQALAGAALLAVVAILGGLAAAGVFSGGHHAAAPATTATPPAAKTRTPTTTQQVTPTPTVAAPTATLKPGDQGAAVKVLQRALAHLGYSPGTVDGDYGPSTTRAVTRFQLAQGLAADGVLGPQTLRALGTALRTG
jgi:Putative peptidoglycan binding domain